jgi:hypothetical protein
METYRPVINLIQKLLRSKMHGSFLNAKRRRFLLILILSLLLSACSSAPTKTYHNPKKPPASHNACTLFQNNPDWYWEALDTYYRWGVPISVQMAIMQRESDFQAGVRPQKKKVLGFIPWGNVTSAYGYAQALNGTWADYQRETKNYKSKRDKFGDASDFVGWYSNKANQELGISLSDAYNLYLAYHEGLAGYQQKTYLQKPWLLNVATTVQQRAISYRNQINQCKYAIKKVDINS